MRSKQPESGKERTMHDRLLIRFWGVRGSVPSPITAHDVAQKKLKILEDYLAAVESGAYSPMLTPQRFLTIQEREIPSTYGGNTSCVEVRYGDDILILDMGTGLRPLGNSLIPEMFSRKGLKAHFVLSHVHWDHIQGLPFFAPLYVNKSKGVSNQWTFLGGTGWQSTAEVCLKGQMDPPTFPVAWEEIEKITGNIAYDNMWDGKEVTLGQARIRFGKLNHPQETYGSRMFFPNGKIIVYATDHEPYDPSYPDPRLISLARDADVVITDCQYTKGQYEGVKEEGGVPRHGWGHSYPEAIAEMACQANVKRVILFHHDPASSDEKIKIMEQHTQKLISKKGGKCKVTAAWEGLEIDV